MGSLIYSKSSATAALAHNGGKAQVNVDFPTIYFDLFAINVLKQSSGWVPPTPTAQTNDPIWPSRLNDDGYPTGPLSGANWRMSDAYINGFAGDVWVLDWTSSGGGTTTLTLAANFTGGGLTTNSISPTRSEYTITGSPLPAAGQGGVAGGPIKVTLDITALSGTLTSVRLYPKTLESLLSGTDATAIFHPNFLSKCRTIGVLRFLNWTQANASKAMKWSQMRQESNMSWCAPQVKASMWYGVCTKGTGNNIYTCPTSFGTLTNGQQIQITWPARPTFTAIPAANVTKGNPTAFNIPSHTFSNGDLVSFEQGNSGGWQATVDAKVLATGLPATYTVTVVDANNITISLNSSALAAPTGTLNLYPRIQLSDGTTTKICWRQGMVNTINSEWGGAHIYPGEPMTATYVSEFDAFIFGGDNNAQLLQTSVPISAIVKLCNYCHAHPWLVFPYISEDDFWTQLATYVKANLLYTLIPRYESGNEVWNFGASFWQTLYAQSIGAKYYGTLSHNYGYAKRFVEVKALIEAVYGTGSDWQMILACQIGDVSDSRLKGPAALNAGNPANYPANKADYVATAPYTNVLFVGNTNNIAGYPGALNQIDNYNQGGASRTTAFDWWLSEMMSPSTPGYGTGDGAIGGTLAYEINLMNTHATYIAAQGYTGRRGTGLRRTHYEGGPTQFNGNYISATGFPTTAPQVPNRAVALADAQNFWADWAISTQAGTFMTNYLTQMASAGVDFPSQFTLSCVWIVAAGTVQGGFNNFGMWKDSNYSSSASSMYTAFINWNNP